LAEITEPGVSNLTGQNSARKKNVGISDILQLGAVTKQMIISNLCFLKKHWCYIYTMKLMQWLLACGLQISYGSQRAGHFSATNYRSVAKAGSHQER